MTKARTSSAKSLRDARIAAGLTQAQLADRLGIRQSQVADYEAGRNEPRVSLYQRWLAVCKAGP